MTIFSGGCSLFRVSSPPGCARNVAGGDTLPRPLSLSSLSSVRPSVRPCFSSPPPARPLALAHRAARPLRRAPARQAHADDLQARLDDLARAKAAAEAAAADVGRLYDGLAELYRPDGEGWEEKGGVMAKLQLGRPGFDTALAKILA